MQVHLLIIISIAILSTVSSEETDVQQNTTFAIKKNESLYFNQYFF